METRIETDSVADKGLQGAARLQPLFQDGHIHPGTIQKFAAEQAAQASPDNEEVFRNFLQ